MEYTGFGLGCGSISAANEALSKESMAILHAALERGVTFLNTADFYGAGESEMGIGQALKGYKRGNVYISLKFGMLVSPKGMMYGIDVHPSRIKNYLTHSLRRMKTDYIDLYQPARIDPSIPVEETVGAIADLVKEGYVREIGLSQIDADTLRRAHKVHPIASVEMEYSLFNRSMEQNILPVARELGIDVVAFGILAHGLLSGAWTKERVERGDVARNAFYIEIFQKGNIEKNILLVEKLLLIAKEKQVSLAQLIYAWSFTKGRDIVPIIGASKVTQFEDSILARDIILTPEDISRIEKAVPIGEISGRSFPH